MSATRVKPIRKTAESRQVEFVPTTEFGRKMWELRKKIENSGIPMFHSWEELEKEIAERKGGIQD